MSEQRCNNCGDPRVPSEEICDKCGGIDFVDRGVNPEGYAAAEAKEKQRLAFAAGKGLVAEGAPKAKSEKEAAKPAEKKADEPEAKAPKDEKKAEKKDEKKE